MTRLIFAMAILLLQYGHTFKSHAQQVPAIEIDTLGWDTYHQGTEILYTSPNGGFVFGNNGYQDRIKTQVFSKPGFFGRAVRVLFKFGSKTFGSGDPDSRMAIRFYKIGGIGQSTNGTVTNAPDVELIDTSGDTTYFTAFLYMDDVDTNGITVVEAPGPASSDVYYTQFGVGLDVSLLAPGDTVGLYSTTDGDAAEAESCWDLTSSGDWVTVLNPVLGWDLDVDPAIFVEFEYESDTVTSINTPTKFEFNSYPNPSNDILTVSLDAPFNEPLDLTILTIDGRMMMRERVNFDAGQRHDISVSELSNGMYLIMATGSDRSFVSRFQVQH